MNGNSALARLAHSIRGSLLVRKHSSRFFVRLLISIPRFEAGCLARDREPSECLEQGTGSVLHLWSHERSPPSLQSPGVSPCRNFHRQGCERIRIGLASLPIKVELGRAIQNASRKMRNALVCSSHFDVAVSCVPFRDTCGCAEKAALVVRSTHRTGARPHAGSPRHVRRFEAAEANA